MSDVLTSKDIAKHLGEDAQHGENLMREMTHLLNTREGPGFKEQVVADMINLQNDGTLPAVEFFDSASKPVTRASEADRVDAISANGQTVYKAGDHNLKLRDRNDSLRSLEGFREQYPDVNSKDPFKVADQQAREQRGMNESQERQRIERDSDAKTRWIECMTTGSDVSEAVKEFDCKEQGLQKPEN